MDEYRLESLSMYVVIYVCMLSCLSHVQLLPTLWTVAHQAHLTMGFSRQEYWSGCHAPCLLCLLHCRQILHPLSHLGSPSSFPYTTQLYCYNVNNSHRQYLMNEQNSTKSLFLDTKFEFHIVFLSHEILFL